MRRLSQKADCKEQMALRCRAERLGRRWGSWKGPEVVIPTVKQRGRCFSGMSFSSKEEVVLEPSTKVKNKPQNYMKITANNLLNYFPSNNSLFSFGNN